MNGVGSFRHAGGDRTPGTYHAGMRWYDTGIMRWTQRDPLDQAGDLAEANRYGYVGGDPVNLTDPTGMKGAGYCPPRHRPCRKGRPPGKKMLAAIACTVTATLIGGLAGALSEEGNRDSMFYGGGAGLFCTGAFA